MILLLTKYLARVQLTIYRLLLGTIIATLLVPILIYFPQSFFNSFLGKALYSIFIIICTFGYRGVQQSLKQLFLFYFISFTVGGGLFGLHYLVQDITGSQTTNFLLNVRNIYGDQVSLLLIIIGFPIVWLFTKNRMDRHVKDKIKYDQMYKCVLSFNNQLHQTIGYIDSGNHLVDPLSNRPVVVSDEPFIRKFFNEEDWMMLRNAIVNNDISTIPSVVKSRISIVPFQGVGGSNDFLYTIRPDKLTIFYEENIIETNNVLIGIQLGNLTADQHYHCLLHPQIIHLHAIKSA